MKETSIKTRIETAENQAVGLRMPTYEGDFH